MPIYELFKTGEIKNNELKEMTVADKDIMVLYSDGNYYITDAKCTHMGGRLAKGKLSGTIITCPLHGSQFDLKDGRVIKWTKWGGFLGEIGKFIKKPENLKVYKVHIINSTVWVEF